MNRTPRQHETLERLRFRRADSACPECGYALILDPSGRSCATCKRVLEVQHA